MPKNSFQKGSVQISTFAGMAIIAAVVVVISTIAVIKYRETPKFPIGEGPRVTAPVAVITPELTPKVTAMPLIDETAGWKTYRNEKYGFELQYPRSLILSENNNYKSDNNQALDKVLLSFNEISDDNFLTINRFEIGKGQTFKDIIENNSWLPGGGTGHADFAKFKSVRIGDNSYYYRYFCGDPSGSVEDGTAACGFFYSYWLVKDQNVYEFELFDVLSTKDMSVDFENSSSNLEFKKILSTFKFTK